MNFKEVLKGRKLMLLGLLVLLFILFKMVPLLDAGQPTFWPTLIFVGCILMNMSCDIFYLHSLNNRMNG